MGKIQKTSPCNIHSSCLVCFMNEKQFWSSLSVREVLISARDPPVIKQVVTFLFLYRKIAFRISLALPFAKTFNCHFLFRSRQSPQTYSSQNQLTHSPVGDPSILKQLCLFFSVLSEIHHSQSPCGPCSRDDRYNVSITACSLIFCWWGVEMSSLQMQK